MPTDLSCVKFLERFESGTVCSSTKRESLERHIYQQPACLFKGPVPYLGAHTDLREILGPVSHPLWSKVRDLRQGNK